MMENVLFDLAAKRRSVRRYTGERLDPGILDEIMKVALTAPNSFGHRPVEFVIVQNEDRIRDLAACKSRGGSQIIGAGAVIAVIVKLDRGELWIEDAAVASAYILLAAEQYGLGACWIQIRNRMGREKSSDEEIRCLLGIPEAYAVLNLIALGHKAEVKSPYTVENLELSNVHYELYSSGRAVT